MFCGCELSFGDPPNTHTCPVCLGPAGRAAGGQRPRGRLRDHDRPGAGLARSRRGRCFTARTTSIPTRPRATRSPSTTCRSAAAGSLGDVRIHRVHLEEDAAKLIHVGESGRIHGSDRSVVDFNRCGTPLVEIVTEPDLRSPEQAHEWLTLLRTTLRQLGVSDVNMDEGSLRCDANVSVRPAGSTELGTKTELKNMNSFRFLERGVRAEIERQTELLRARRAGRPGDAPLRPRLRAPDAAALQGGGARLPLLPGARPGAAAGHRRDARSAPRRSVPELPAARAQRFERELGLNPDRARDLAFRRELADYFERALASRAGRPGHARSRSPTGSRSWWSGSAPTPIRPQPRLPGGAGLAGGDGRRQGGQPRRRARGADDARRRRAEIRATIVEREGLGALGGEDGDGLAAIVDARDRRRPRRGGQGQRPAT